jgi:hypothetical protein
VSNMFLKLAIFASSLSSVIGDVSLSNSIESRSAHIGAVTALSEENRLNALVTGKVSTLSVDATCTITAENPCNFRDFEVGQTVQIFPGGDTACLESSVPYSFTVTKGSSSKLLYYFQGGGLCWDETTFLGGYCRPIIILDEGHGIMDKSDSNNPFKDYSVINNMYCSGDAHVGHADGGFADHSGQPVLYRGFDNTKAVLAWAERQQGKGKKTFLDKNLDELVVVGASAGGSNIAPLSRLVMDTLKAKSTAVVRDGAVNVFPASFQGFLANRYGVCTSTLLVGDEQLLCQSYTLTSSMVLHNTLAAYPNTVFTDVTAVADYTQMLFLNAVLIGGGGSAVDAATYWALTGYEMSTANTFDNYVAFVMSGSNHVLTADSFYLTEAASTDTATGTVLSSWLAKLPLKGKNDALSTVCASGACEAAGLIPKTTCNLQSRGGKNGKGGSCPKVGKGGKRLRA